MSDKSPDRLPTPEETEQTLAETAKVRAETAKLLAEAEEATAKAGIARDAEAIGRLHRGEIERGVRKELADNVHHRIYLFSGAVAESSVKSCIRQLTEWHLAPGRGHPRDEPRGVAADPRGRLRHQRQDRRGRGYGDLGEEDSGAHPDHLRQSLAHDAGADQEQVAS